MKPLKISVWNANGLCNHVHDLELFLKEKHVDVMMISETHFTQKSFIRLKGYTIYTTNHPAGRARGGTAVIIKNVIKHSTKTPFQTPSIQATSIEVACDYGIQSRITTHIRIPQMRDPHMSCYAGLDALVAQCNK